MTKLSTYNEISIAEIVFYSVVLVCGIFLTVKHGFGGSGFRYLVVLALARLIGASLELATISDPTDKSLLIGWLITNGVAVGPFILMLVGFTSRMFDSIRRSGQSTLSPLFSRAIQLLTAVALVLLIIGGTKSTYTITDGTESVDYNKLSEVGDGLMLLVLAFLIFEVIMCVLNKDTIAKGEHRILPAVLACLPFVIVRLAYSCYLVFGDNTGTVWQFLGMEVVMEMVVAVIALVLGFSLEKAPRAHKPAKRDEEMNLNNNYQNNNYQNGRR